LVADGDFMAVIERSAGLAGAVEFDRIRVENRPLRPCVLESAPVDRKVAVQQAFEGFVSRGGSARARRARARLSRVLWNRHGERRLPGASELDEALSAVSPDDLAWICEFAELGPLYFLPTRRFVSALARTFRELGVKRVLEVGAGDGFLARALQAHAPWLEVIATDSGAWQRPEARMTAAEQKRLAGTRVPGLALGSDVKKMSAKQAIRTFAPDAVLGAWLVPGPLLDSLIRSPVRYVLEIGAGSGVTGNVRSWRFAHDFLEGPLLASARCRLDARPRRALSSSITLYHGKASPEHHEERPKRGDFLWQLAQQR
jgi:hypothetical protein